MMSTSNSSRRFRVVPPDSKKIVQMYFGKNPVAGSDGTSWKCTCGTVRKQNIKLGYANLMSHIKAKHPDYLEVFTLAQQGNEQDSSISSQDFSSTSSAISVTAGRDQQMTLTYLFDTRSTNVFKWLEWIVLDEHELIFCEKNLTRCNSKLEPISVKTLKKYLFKVVDAVEKKITQEARMASAFALVFDGWSEASRHFIGLFIVFPGKGRGNDDGDVNPIMYLLAFAPLLDETNFSADNHATFIKATLEWFSLSRERLFCLIGDNCSTNKATANRLGVPLLGCRSHRLNLAVEQYLKKFLAAESELVGKLMSKLATLKLSGRLRLMTSLRPVKRNETRWTGVPDMFQRFERLLPNLDSANKDEIMDLIPNANQEKNIKERKQALADFKSVTIALQGVDMSIKESDVLFRSIIDEYTEFDFEAFLGADANIIHDKVLEKAVLKIQSSKEETLTADEKESVSKLLRCQTTNEQESTASCEDEERSDAQLTFAERALKRQRIQEKTGVCSNYINTNFLLPTSCVVERLFSQAKRVFSPHRRRLHTKTLEALLFLNQNRRLWNLKKIFIFHN